MPMKRISRTERSYDRRWAKELEGLVQSQANANTIVGWHFQDRRITRSVAKQSSTRATRARLREAGKATTRSPTHQERSIHAQNSTEQRRGRTLQTKQQENAALPRYPSEAAATKVPAWLQQVHSVSPTRTPIGRLLRVARMPNTSRDPSEVMNSSSTSRERQDDESTVKVAGSRPGKLTDNKLRYRGVKRKSLRDERLPHLHSILRTTLPKLSVGEVAELGAVAEHMVDHVRNHASESCWTAIDNFSLTIDKEKHRLNYPIINQAYFDAQLKKCLSKNEAVLQRTLMMSVFHYYWLGDMFDWNAEAQWILPRDVRLPSSAEDEVTSPKPDLMITFTLESFTGPNHDRDPIPLDLERCISPDGGERCFPFLFMEVKKAASDLQDAYMANLHNASQALYNIYLWMLRADKQQIFFNKIRVFSFVFNAQDLSVRVHRAYPDLDDEAGGLHFYFDELYPLTRYNRDQVCLLVNTIIQDYAAKELHGELLAVYKEVVLEEKRRVLIKRKDRALAGSNAKRPRKSGDASQHTGQSFGMSQMQT